MQYTNPTIKQLEDLVVELDNCRQDNFDAINWILHTRKTLLNQEALKYQSELLPHIVRFNDLLKGIVTKAYNKAKETYMVLSENFSKDDDVSVLATCWISACYPQGHPLHKEPEDRFWEALCYRKYNDYYENGITNTIIRFSKKNLPTLEEILTGAPESKNNWNQGLDPILTKDLHLIYLFNRLFVLTSFALTDLIYVKEFSIDITAEITTEINYD